MQQRQLFYYILILKIFFFPIAIFTQQTKPAKKPASPKEIEIKKANDLIQKDKEDLAKEKEEFAKTKEDFKKEKEILEKQKEELQKQKENLEQINTNKTPVPKEEESTEEDFFRLEESISIVSKRIGEAEKTSKTSAIVSVYNRETINDMGARNLADILKQVPGVEVLYDQFGSYKVAFRGVLSRSGVLMLLDGHRINNFYDGSTFLDIRADAIEKVEIIRGPGSSIHGTNAFVGVINVVTRNSAGRGKNGYVASRLGSYNTLEPTAYYNFKMGESWSLSTYAGYYESKRPQVHLPNDQSCGKTLYRQGKCDSVVPLPVAPYIKTNDRKKQTNLFLNLNHGENFYIKGKMIREDRGPNVGEIGFLTPDSELNFNLMTLDIGSQKIALTEKLSLSARVYGDSYLRQDQIQVERTDMASHIGVSPIKKTGYKYDTKGTEAILQYNPIPQLSIMLGAQLERLTYKDAYIQKNFAGNNTSTLYPFFYDYDNLDKDRNDTILSYMTTGKAFVSDQDSLKKGKSKYRNIHAEFAQILWDPLKWLSITMGVRRDTYSDFGSTINPKSGIVITAFEKTKYGSLSFKFLFGSAFRAPTFQEMYDKSQTYQFGGVLGNNTQRFQNYGQAGYGQLKPETLKTGEVGIDYHTPYKPLSFQANWFYTRIYNNIDGVNVSSTPPGKLDVYHNLRGLTILGSEIEGKLSYSSRNYIFANFSWFQAVDNGGLNGVVTTDTKTFLTSLPQARANLGINWNIFKYFILNNTIWASSERSSNARFAFERQSIKGFQYPQYYIWNISLGTTEDLIENLEFRFSIFNVQNFKLYDNSNTATEDYANRAIPAAYIYQRYIEFKMTYFIN